MTNSPLEELVMLQPIAPGDLYEIVQQQLTASLASYEEDPLRFVHTCHTFFWCLVEDTFDTRVYEDKWSRDLGRYVDNAIGYYAVGRHQLFIRLVAGVIEHHSGDNSSVIVEVVESDLWQVVQDVSECIQLAIIHYAPKRRSA
ncbi:MAG: hypothetical protein RLZZ70_607 [Candidatus Parcubacteria bacterium]|jgi:hypothetical protein